jgi:hypothetical protein
MTPRTVRRAERAAHLVWGGAIAAYVYGVLPAWGEPVLRWVVIPAAVASGLAMWFAAPIRRVLRRRTVGEGLGTATSRRRGIEVSIKRTGAHRPS